MTFLPILLTQTLPVTLQTDNLGLCNHSKVGVSQDHFACIVPRESIDEGQLIHKNRIKSSTKGILESCEYKVLWMTDRKKKGEVEENI